MVPRRLSHAQENPVTAIDIALEPDATMVRQAEADNARLLKAYPEGFALDATHHAHITMLQQFVRTADLKKVYSAAAFVSTDGGRDIQQGLIDYVANFTTVAAGEKFNPHVTIGVATETYLKKMLAEPFKAFTFSPVGASVYQLGSFGAARKELQALSLRL